ncbi:MAG: phosphatase PAP2 family protein [Myxococcales bacterium]|nr:phosphatase PAP2 family protein [Myxococcales bacterium]
MNSFQQAVALAAVIALYALMRSAVRGTRAPGGPAPVPAPATEGAFGHLATQDWMVTSYLLVLTLLVGFGSGDRQPQAMRWILLDDLGFVFLLALARAPQTPRRLADMAYRIALPGAIIATFTQLHYILPSASATSWDAQIYAADKALFHFEPAEAWDRYVNPRTTEWFSFFYYLYFGILLVHIVPMSLFERRMHVLREFSWGIFTVFCVGQLVYTLVPGFGPYRLLAARFEHPLEGDVFWPLVAKTVASFDGTHRTDIFPSLHTAVPSFFTLFAYRHRDKLPFRYTWPLMAFVTTNIILATMFLRWHYLLDVLAGLTLAATAFATARRLPAREDARRSEAGLPPIWRPLFGDSLPARGRSDAEAGGDAPQPLDAPYLAPSRTSADRADRARKY